MRLQLILVFSLLLSTFMLSAQPNPVVINPNVKLLEDSLEHTTLIAALNDFLLLIEESPEENKFIYPPERIETLLLLDELPSIQKSRISKVTFFYKPYLKNIIPLEKDQYLLQLSYLAVHDNTPLEKASIELIAHKVEGGFLFASPLSRNTKNWKSLKINNITFRFKAEINRKKALEFEAYVSTFDQKLEIGDKRTTIYCSENLPELLKLIGLNYMADYNGRKEASTLYHFGNEVLIIEGINDEAFNNFDPHDLWHNRLSLRKSRRLVNKPMDEACAYLYGGSWGMSWDEILTVFMTKVAINKDSDWADYKENRFNFGESPKKHLMVDYVINALLIQKIEKEHGFSAVWELIDCGTFEKGNKNYYRILEKWTGITKSTYNENVWKLIDEVRIINPIHEGRNN